MSNDKQEPFGGTVSSYRARSVAPNESAWRYFYADSPEDAAQQWLAENSSMHHDGVKVLRYKLDPELAEIVVFALVEVEGHGTWIARLYVSGIGRPGGVKASRDPSALGKIAAALGWTGTPEELLAPGWVGEEDYGRD